MGERMRDWVAGSYVLQDAARAKRNSHLSPTGHMIYDLGILMQNDYTKDAFNGHFLN